MRLVSRSILTTAMFGFGVISANSAFATNGMNLEGYGPIASGMGGASMAYDNGTAAVMNNPATLGLGQGSRVDAALGVLGPNVKASMMGMPDATSSADAFYMPALGWSQRHKQMTFGLGVFSQGGMGTEYAANSFMAAGSNDAARSEVSVGRVLAPLTYNVNPNLVVGGSVDMVWAGMDIKMAMGGSQFGDMVGALGGTQQAGSASGTMVDGMVGMLTAPQPMMSGVNWARFDFSNGSAFTGEAKGMGVAGKLGAVYKVNRRVSLGATYHSKTALGDLTTKNSTITMNANMDDNLLNQTWDGGATGTPAGTYTATNVPVTGEMKVKDFEWPATYGVGVAVQATDRLMVAGDVKRINWSTVMQNFNMAFTADANQNNAFAAGFAGATMDATLLQDWKDQTVIALGGAYRVTDALTVRAGFNHASNPVPDKYLNALFPAIVENHMTLGAGYRFNKASSVDFALSRASQVTATAASGVESSHDQMSWQMMYSYRF